MNSSITQDFAGKVALVTGAGSGIGHAMAQQLLARGAVVVAGDLDTSGCPAASVPVTLDVSDEGSVQDFTDVGLAQAGRIDVLCNNAGIGSTTSVADSTLDDWERVFSVNARGVFLGIRAVVPHMLQQQSGSIVNTASVAGMIGLKSRASYCASKGAVIVLTKQVAVEYAGTGIRCNCISPGTVDSPWVGRLLNEADAPLAARAALIARQPIGRLGEADEIARAALFLASDEAGFMTGTNLVIDGGLTAA
ncbi:MAG: NAD(P)-dependent dehydrogenase (short-subunit alcohol dehydrogenase family) [Glaciecola sp.]|jgi:NAD(P)-dependent dehydrogenase (short-subunit alcohol dehydrogenase family)